MPLFIFPAFFIVAILYSSVGFGGGSSYTAILVLAGISFQLIAPISLISNICVVTGNSINFAKAKIIDLQLITMLAIPSIPMAYLGGKIIIDKNSFIWILIITLFLSGFALLFTRKNIDDTRIKIKKLNKFIALAIGAVLGLIAGLTGIGGGILLSPILYHLKAANSKQIAATSSLFILVNSLAGLFGQWQKFGFKMPLDNSLLLPLIVLIGGQIGNRITLKHLSSTTLAKITSILVIFAAIQLTLKQLNIF